MAFEEDTLYNINSLACGMCSQKYKHVKTELCDVLKCCFATIGLYLTTVFAFWVASFGAKLCNICQETTAITLYLSCAQVRKNSGADP